MLELKRQLSELIEAYAVARATGNETLIRSSASAVVQFLESIEITMAPTDSALTLPDE